MNPFSRLPEKNINTTVFHLSVHIWVLRGSAFQHAVWWHSAATPTPAHIPSCCVWGTVLPRVESRRRGSCVLGPMLRWGGASLYENRRNMEEACRAPGRVHPALQISNSWGGNDCYPLLQPRRGEAWTGEPFGQSQTLGKWQSQSSDPGSFSPESALFTSPLTNEHDPLKLWERGKDSCTEGVEAPVPSLDSFV